MGLFFWGCNTLKQPRWAVEYQSSIFDTFEALKGYLALTYFIKYQYIGEPWDALDDLLWNFEYLTSVPFCRPITADF